jgi:hypothetical protein
VSASPLLSLIRRIKSEAKAGRLPVAKIKKIVDAFDWESWHKDSREALEAPLTDVAMEQAERTARTLGLAFDRDDPFVREQMTGYVGALITDLDKTTRQEVADLIRRAVEDPDAASSPAALGDAIGSMLRDKFDGYADWRADRIARTETANLYNVGTVLASRQAGVTRVRVLDGDQDEECAAADGQVWDLDYALAHPTAHPNCTRAFVPVENEEE